ncbi:hypothetical protein K439DRAFT_1325062 [Ramaria rubella]|nr:hypothetical protein K439DRAFT_1325062 [Ramaria rubella]
MDPIVDLTVDPVRGKKKKEKRKKQKDANLQVASAANSPAVNDKLDLSAFIQEPSSATGRQSDSSTSAAVSAPQQDSDPSSSTDTGSGSGAFAQFNNNDDILRAFQGLDLTRLAGVLQGLPFTTEDLDTSPHDRQSTSKEVNAPAKRKAAATKCPSNPKSMSESCSNLAAIGPSIANPEHTRLLATKWLSAKKLKKLVDTEGLVYRKGKFSAIEEQALKAAIENFRVNRGLTSEELMNILFANAKDDDFWTEITSSVPARPITAVYHHVHRIYHPLKGQGKWSDAEDAALLSAVGDLGQAWSKVSERVGRTAQDCRDRYRNHASIRSEKESGRWSKEEEEQLTRIVQELTTEQGKNSDHEIFWSIVSKRMGNKRGRHQCRIKWTDSLSRVVKNGGESPRWSGYDAFILVHKVASMDVRDDTEIDWKLLPDEDWNLWSAHLLQRRWRTLKHAIKGHEEMTFQGSCNTRCPIISRCPCAECSRHRRGLEAKVFQTSCESPRRRGEAPTKKRRGYRRE